MSSAADGDRGTALGLVCIVTSATASTGLPGKSKGTCVVNFVCHILQGWRYLDCVLMTDQEPAITALVDAVREARVGKRTLHRKIPRYSHASLGYAEQANWTLESLSRMLYSHLELRYRM